LHQFTGKHPIHEQTQTEGKPRGSAFDKPLHPLHTQEMVDQINQQLVGGYAWHHHRRQGKSTAAALKYIAKAVEHPGVPIILLDHYGTSQSNQHLSRMVVDLIHKLDLQHMHVSRNRQGNFSLVFGKELKNPPEPAKDAGTYVTIVAGSDFERGRLTLSSSMSLDGIITVVSNRAVELEDRLLRNRLISEGWTPPGGRA
jgi:hypothetical protein